MRNVCVFGKRGCTHCVALRELFAEHGIEFTYIDVSDEMPKAHAFLSPLIGDFKTYPQVFVNATWIEGGCSMMRSYAKDGLLHRTIDEAASKPCSMMDWIATKYETQQ